MRWIIAFLLQTLISAAMPARPDMIVDQKGHGDFRSVTEAVDALAMYPYQRTVIFIRNGIYKEKIRIDQNYITLRGESRDSTIIRYAQLRSDWLANRDYTGPAVVNLYGNDLILENLTIENAQPEIGPHAFAVYGVGTRTILIHCNLISKGGDTVSLWNYQKGMYYHNDCRFEGAVDLVCPRGWCFIRDSEFYEVKETAALWHDGHYDPDQKLVVVNSSFDGVKGFQLGRHHYEAQFFLIGCRFSSALADRPVYRHVYSQSDRNNPFYLGDRKYFYQCKKEGQPFGWLRDNLRDAPGPVRPEMITPAWTFGGVWDPESADPVEIVDWVIDGNQITFRFNEIVSVHGLPVLRNADINLKLMQQRFNDIPKLTFVCDEGMLPEDLNGVFVVENGEIFATTASVYERRLESRFVIP